MAQGAAYKAISKDIKWYYSEGATFPTTLAQANTIAAVGNLFAHTTGDPAIPSGAGDTADTPIIESREHGASQVVYADDITPAPRTGAASTVDVQFNTDMPNTVHEDLLEADNDTEAVVIADIQTSAGDGTRGNAAGNAEGTLDVCKVKHNAATLTLPSSATFTNASVTFRLDGTDSRKLFHYGQP